MHYYLKNKPRIYFNSFTQRWICRQESGNRVIHGFGDSPEEAYYDLVDYLRSTRPHDSF